MYCGANKRKKKQEKKNLQVRFLSKFEWKAIHLLNSQSWKMENLSMIWLPKLLQCIRLKESTLDFISVATSYLCLFLQKYQVSFSMLEIYNEQVRDLLVKNNPKGGLQVRLKGRRVWRIIFSLQRAQWVSSTWSQSLCEVVPPGESPKASWSVYNST